MVWMNFIHSCCLVDPAPMELHRPEHFPEIVYPDFHHHVKQEPSLSEIQGCAGKETALSVHPPIFRKTYYPGDLPPHRQANQYHTHVNQKTSSLFGPNTSSTHTYSALLCIRSFLLESLILFRCQGFLIVVSCSQTVYVQDKSYLRKSMHLCNLILQKFID